MNSTRALALCALILVSHVPSVGAQSESELREMQARAAAATATGAEHKALEYFLGEWDVQLAMVMPGMPPQRSTGRARFEWLIPGRWVSQRVDGTLMGMPYQSFSMIGYDTFAKNHVVATVSSMDNALNLARGVTVDPEGKNRVLYGVLDEYMTGELAKPFKTITRIQNADRFVLEIWDLGIGVDGAKVLEFSHTRRR
ncbi:MAG TPA: DUF1579 family protein [Gemmatimonadales bacterium]|nr:DUF1579 family protein [Gemmatimonadales bacterium]